MSASKFSFNSLPRCGAKARSNFCLPCKQPARKNSNGRCYLHSGRPPKNGIYTKKSYEERIKQRHSINELRQFNQSVKQLIKQQKKVQ